MGKEEDDGGIDSISNIGMIRRVSRLTSTPRVFVRSEKVPITRDHRPRTIEFGANTLEARAIALPGATLPERIVYKKLVQLLPGGLSDFLFQRTEGGGRTRIGGFVLDFLIIHPLPPIAIEVLGDFWHQAKHRFADEERMLAVLREGYHYGEIWEHDIYASDALTEQILWDIIHRQVDLT